jgi:hypothetical protein
MRFTTFYKFLMIAPLSVALGWTQQQSSLGEIAKQGKTGKKAKIVLTDDDVLHSTAPMPSAAVDSASTADAKPAADSSTDPKPKAGTAQQSKDPKVNELRQKVEKLKSAEETYKGGLKAGQERVAKATSAFERDTAQEVVNNQTHNVQVTHEKLQQAQAELSAAEQPKQ